MGKVGSLKRNANLFVMKEKIIQMSEKVSRMKFDFSCWYKETDMYVTIVLS